MSFNHDSSKKALEIAFYRRNKRPNHPVLIFNHIQENQTLYQKYLGMILDDKLNLAEHLKYITDNKVKKSIGQLRKRQMILPRRSLYT